MARAAPSKPRAARPAGRGEIDTVSWWDAFYRVARRIPRGRVCTYGLVAALAGKPRAARHVGFAMAALKDEGESRDVPWHRVVGARSRGRAAISIKDPMGGAVQRMLLEAEGVRFDDRGAISLDVFGWSGSPNARAKSAKPIAKGAPKRERSAPSRAGFSGAAASRSTPPRRPNEGARRR